MSKRLDARNRGGSVLWSIHNCCPSQSAVDYFVAGNKRRRRQSPSLILRRGIFTRESSSYNSALCMTKQVTKGYLATSGYGCSRPRPRFLPFPPINTIFSSFRGLNPCQCSFGYRAAKNGPLTSNFVIIETFFLEAKNLRRGRPLQRACGRVEHSWAATRLLLDGLPRRSPSLINKAVCYAHQTSKRFPTPMEHITTA